jgi:hypothetical protein
MTKRGDQEKIIQALLKKIGQALISESEPKEEKKTPREEYIDVYTASEPTKKAERYNYSPRKVKNQEVMLALEAIQKDREQINEQKKSMENEKIKIADQHNSLARAKLEVNKNG